MRAHCGCAESVNRAAFIVEACNAHDRLTRERDEAVALLREDVGAYDATWRTFNAYTRANACAKNPPNGDPPRIAEKRAFLARLDGAK